MADCYNLVGFQNHLKFSEQLRVFRMIPGLENAEFLRFGQIHRNSYINSPRLIHPTLQSKNNPKLFVAGQIWEPVFPPRSTACGSLCYYISFAGPENFQPANITFGLLPEVSAEMKRSMRDRKARHRWQVQECLRQMDDWIRSAEAGAEAVS
jgi:methylenetetrahydrofolate--tRNA-(uracil-5-)-methyltransferase